MQENVKGSKTDVLFTRENTSDNNKLKHLFKIPYQQTAKNEYGADPELGKTRSSVGLRNADYRNAVQSLGTNPNDIYTESANENIETETNEGKYTIMENNQELDDAIEMGENMVGGIVTP